MSALPFDGEHSAAIQECIELASLEQLGREAARRCHQAYDVALAAKERARSSDDLLEIAAAAEMAYEAAQWCGRLASAANSLIGNADIAEIQRCFELARNAGSHAALAATRWHVMKRVKGGAVV